MQMSFLIDGEGTASVRSDLVGSGKEPLDFAFWNVQGDIVRDNVARYVAETGESVACWEIGQHYEDRLTAAFAAGQGPDVFYAQRAEAALWGSLGAIASINEMAFAPVLSQMDPRMVDGARDADARVLGLTYYNGGPFALFAHTNYPAVADQDFHSWAGVLDALHRAKRDGLAEHPFLPRWHRSQTGLVWSLICHLASEGVLGLEQDDADAILTRVLEFFLALVDQELVPPESLDDSGDAPALARWTSGRHMLSFTTDYLAMDAAKISGRGVNVVLPLPGGKGLPLMPGHALLCLRAGIVGERRQRAERLLTYLGGPAPDGRLRVHDRWLRECLFGVPFAQLEQAPGMRAAMAGAFAPAHAERSLQRLTEARAAAVMSPMTQDPRMLAWTRLADTTIRQRLMRQRISTPAEASERLLSTWFSLGGD